MTVTLRMTYPGLYHEANDASNARQKLYMNLIKGEYTGLIVAAVFSLELSERPIYFVFYAMIFGVPFGLLIIRSFLKPEQGWYQSRALAESIKTSTWKYVMRAAPFGDAKDALLPRANFRNHLADILKINEHVGRNFGATAAEMEQVTAEMDALRSQGLQARLEFYVAHRITDQRTWYAKKASTNKRWARRTVFALGVIYVLAVLCVLSRIAEPTWRLAHPEPLVVLASALVGWMQIKKFNELGTAYNLTAIEIGILKARAPEISTDEHLSRFVDDAEQAFSREHTQWIARQST